MPDTLLSVRDLSVSAGDAQVVREVSFELERGGTLGIVGESGSGKSLTCRSILGILPPGCELGTSAAITFDGVELHTLDYESWLPYRGNRISAVFQDPGSYLNPSIAVGRQLTEVLRVKSRLTRRDARERAVDLLTQMGLRDPARVFKQYPFELSGGMLQRVLIAIAISGEPDLLIADEATTALDVTVQAEVLDLLAELRERIGLALVLVSHDLAVISQVCDNVVVMRAGEIVERGTTADVLRQPRHEYTKALIESHSRYGIEKLRAGEAVRV
ncbi:ABC transporter ATP-binding protein [Tenggerimyces flavus]|uniref:ABC transporter ATP-binding protein n=1 Tax=Tenggerimyces flavus TaxID=1708749 RepID=A0ABV7YH23_9ACTN|nr:ABC transporter ATP-binding protein [Tenggerimyces flavus]MBM7784739.1 peptide/nickel transport system ATP-binding protein [Tenggerimyces flavus]